MNTLDYIIKKYNIDLSKIPEGKYVIIPGVKRLDLVKDFSELNFKVGAEIGVMRGGFSKMICENNPQAKLYAVDPWKVYEGFDDFDKKGVQALSFYNDAVASLSKYNCEIVRKFSMDAVNDFIDESLDFVYIDANHSLKYVVEDIVEWSKKVKVGGIVAGHDFKLWETDEFKTKYHVVQALNAYISSYGIDYVFILGKQRSKNRDLIRSWFFVKK
jgi:hypothetical protein